MQLATHIKLKVRHFQIHVNIFVGIKLGCDNIYCILVEFLPKMHVSMDTKISHRFVSLVNVCAIS
jgi:hypothetical protein